MARNNALVHLNSLVNHLPEVNTLLLNISSRNNHASSIPDIEFLLNEISYHQQFCSSIYESLWYTPITNRETEQIMTELLRHLLVLIEKLLENKNFFEGELLDSERIGSHGLSSSNSNTAGNETQGKPGRPEKFIDFGQVSNLLSVGFKWKKIAELLGVSESFLRKKRKNLNETEISDRNLKQFSSISTIDLDLIVREILDNSPNSGEKMVIGALQSRGLKIQRDKVRLSLDRVNPDRNSIRRKIVRRVYSVGGPNHLWHMDGNHKLIRWRFVIHGCIDGFSRLIVFLKCVTNNRAATVLDHFEKAIQRYRCPLRIRSDYGTENIEVARWMLNHHGPDKKPYLTGLSVHNQRIERLWNEVRTYVIQHFANLFHHLESISLLDPDNDIHLFALHYTFQPRINSLLNELMESWNNHGLRTEHNQTPLQLWIAGFYQHDQELLITTAPDLVDDWYGEDDSEPTPELQTSNDVQVPSIDIDLTDDQYEYIFDNFIPTENDNSFGVTIYERIISYLVSV